MRRWNDCGGEGERRRVFLECSIHLDTVEVGVALFAR